MELTSDNVKDIFFDCLLQEDEIDKSTHTPKVEIVEVDGLLNKFGLHKDRVISQKAEIEELCDQLPDEMKEGQSFVKMCYTKAGDLWGEHQNMEQLAVLGQAIGKINCLMPREFWTILPGGMPYYIVN